MQIPLTLIPTCEEKQSAFYETLMLKKSISLGFRFSKHRPKKPFEIMTTEKFILPTTSEKCYDTVKLPSFTFISKLTSVEMVTVVSLENVANIF